MLIRRVAAALLALAAWLPVCAATVSERSPFTQGQWWDPTRPGNGFELFNVGNEGMALWFTFDDGRNPVWYTAQGEIGTTWTVPEAVIYISAGKFWRQDDSGNVTGPF